MSVEILFNIFGKGASSAVTAFSDPLTVVDPLANGSGIGKNWIQGIKSLTPISNPISAPTANIGLSSLDATNALGWAAVGTLSSNTQWHAHAIPIPTYLGCFGKTQFAQCTMVQSTGPGYLRGGLEVGTYGAQIGDTGYFFGVYNGDLSWHLVRWINGGPTILQSAAGPMANGDVFRLSMDLSVGGQATIVVKRNGSVLTTATDVGGLFINYGSPALACDFANIGVSNGVSEWRTF